MRLYYFTSHRVATEHVLPERRMRLSQVDDLNDPFELLAYAMPDRAQRHVFKLLRSYLASTKGVMCFSEAWSSPVMWAHYADKHRGVCLGFDLPDDPDMLHSISYKPSRLAHILRPGERAAGLTADDIRKVLFTKGPEWSYEREWRALADLKEQDVNGSWYVDFGEQITLREVIIGLRNDTPVGQMAKLCKGLDGSVLVFKARAAFNSFEVVRNLNVKAINVPAKARR